MENEFEGPDAPEEVVRVEEPEQVDSVEEEAAQDAPFTEPLASMMVSPLEVADAALGTIPSLPWKMLASPIDPDKFYLTSVADESAPLIDGLSYEGASGILALINSIEPLALYARSLEEAGDKGAQEAIRFLTNLVTSLRLNPPAPPVVETAGDLSYLNIGGHIVIGEGEARFSGTISGVSVAGPFVEVKTEEGPILILNKDTAVALDTIPEITPEDI